MNYRTLGSTGLRVSEVALDCAGFEGESREKVCREIAYAAKQGVNFIDLYASEPELRSNIGAALAEIKNNFVIQGHLCSVWQNGQYLRSRDANLTREAFEDLLYRLGTDSIDIGMIHYVDGMKDWLEVKNGPIMQYALELKKQGKIKHIGMGSHNPDVAIAAVESGLIEVLLFAVNPCYDMQPGGEDPEKLWADESYERELVNQNEQRKRLYELCEARGVGIGVMKAFGGGDLLDAELSPFKKAFTPVQCIHYALTRPAVAAVMCGCRSEGQIDEALAYETASDVQRDYSGVLGGLGQYRFEGHCLYCGHCAPCIVGINVAAVTKFLNLCTAQGCVPETELNHYELLEHHAGECIACGACEGNCPFGVPIMRNMSKAAELFGK